MHIYYENYFINVQVDDSEKPYQCVACSNSFWTLNSFLDHSKNCLFAMNTSVEPYVSHSQYFQPHSLGSASSCVELASKKVGQHPCFNRRKQCMVCGRRFSQSSSLIRHMKVHKGAKFTACEICGVTFNKPEFLTKHMRLHGRKFNCSVCKTRFMFRGDLTKHIKSFHRSFFLRKMFNQLRAKSFVKLERLKYHFL